MNFRHSAALPIPRGKVPAHTAASRTFPERALFLLSFVPPAERNSSTLRRSSVESHTQPEITFFLNGAEVQVRTSRETPLWQVLCEQTATAESNGHYTSCAGGSHHRCSVLVNGKVTLSCETPVAEVEGKHVIFVPNSNNGKGRHPIQRALQLIPFGRKPR